MSLEEKSCVARVDRKFGRFSYDILNFSSLSTEVGRAIEGPDFELCGHFWQLRLFPGGSLPQHKGYVSFYLASKSDKDARASYRLSILSQVEGGENKSYSSNGWRLFKAKSDQVDGWGRDKFIRLSELLDPHEGFSINDSVLIEVEIIVHGEVQHLLQTNLCSRRINENTLEHAMNLMLNDEKTSDILLLVGQDEFPIHAHRFILIARSRVFRAMLTTCTYENSHGCIKISDVEPSVMVETLRFMYTDVLPTRDIMTTHALTILVVAIKYEVNLLVDHCENFLCCRVDDKNALDVLCFADSISSAQLRQRALFTIAHHAVSILQSQEFQELDEELQQEVFRSIQKIGNSGLCVPKIRFIESEGFDGKKRVVPTSIGSSGCNIS